MRRLGVVVAIAWVTATPFARSEAQARPTRDASVVRADTFWSQALGVRKRVLIYLPPSYEHESARRYPVIYYLHGLYGDEGDWARLGGLPTVMDSLIARGTPEMIVVMPDGDDGWYTTWNSLGNYAQCRRAPARDEPAESYCVPWPHYDDYIARDLVAFVDSSYRTRRARASRGIAGLSMGGYGAVTLALRYPGVWSAAASHSGVLSPLYKEAPTGGAGGYATSAEEIRSKWTRFWFAMGPAFGSDTAGWRARDPATLLRRAAAGGRDRLPRLFVDVGLDDPFLSENRDFHRALTELGIAHEYREWPGKHDWVYWRAHVAESVVWLAGVVARD